MEEELLFVTNTRGGGCQFRIYGQQSPTSNPSSLGRSYRRLN